MAVFTAIILPMVTLMGGATPLWVTRMDIMVVIDRGIFHPIINLIGSLTEGIVHSRAIVAAIIGETVKMYMDVI